MSEQGLQQQKASQTNIYKLLADCYRMPGEDLGETISLLVDQFNELHPESVAETSALQQAFSASQVDKEALQVAYAKLFVGPYELVAAPYGSVYLEGDRRVMGETTMDAADHYTRAGLSPDPDNKEPPDHISTELEFMYFLGFQHLSNEDESYLAAQKTFLLDHLSRWVALFANKVIQGNVSPLYNHLAILTASFIAKQSFVEEAPGAVLDGGGF